MDKKLYSNQQASSTFQPQTYRHAGFEKVNAGRTETHSSADPTSLDAKQPLVGIIDQGFGAGEHGTEVLKTIAESNSQSPTWLGQGVGNGNWANSLNKFVDAAKTLGHRAVANLSFDLTEKHPDGSVTTRSQLTAAEQQALTNAHDNGVLIVASAGNQGGNMSALGAASQQFDNIITVGAAEGNHRASYSSYGSGLDLVAPGSETGSAFTGTSRSAAEVTGAISQVWAANSALDYHQVTGVLESTAKDLDKPGWDAETGFGELNPLAAIDLAQKTQPETYTFSGAQLIQQPVWKSVDGAIASARPDRFIVDKPSVIRAAPLSPKEHDEGVHHAGAAVKPNPAKPHLSASLAAKLSPDDRDARPASPKEHDEGTSINRAKHAVESPKGVEQLAHDPRFAAERNQARTLKQYQEHQEYQKGLTQIVHNPHLSNAERDEARSLLQKQAKFQREQRAAVAERQRLAQEKASLTQIVHNPHLSNADRNEARALLHPPVPQSPVKPNQPANLPPPEEKKSWWDSNVTDRLNQAKNVAENTASTVGDWAKRNKDSISEVAHTGLDVVGMIPVAGTVAEGINAGLYAVEGDYTNAAVSVAAMVPLEGDVVIGGKLTMKGAKLAERAYAGYSAEQAAQGAVQGVSDASSEFAKGNYLNGANSLVQAGLSVIGVRDGARAAGGHGSAHPGSPGSSSPAPLTGGNGGSRRPPKDPPTGGGGSHPPSGNGSSPTGTVWDFIKPTQSRTLDSGGSKTDKPLGARGPRPLDKPSDQGTHRGEASKRQYFPDQSGGSTLPLSTERLQVKPNGVARVEQHVSRFGPDPKNQAQVQRLKDHLANPKDHPLEKADLEFYAHELRESARYRKLGYEDRKTGEVWQPSDQDEAYQVWNDTHTATLEDYGIKEGQGVLYHPSVESG